MKIKGYRFPCEVCGDNQVVCSIQVFFRKNGEVSYARARHQDKTKKFYYHQQSIEYVKCKLRELTNIDPCQESKNRTIEQIEPNSTSISKLMAGGEGFEPRGKWRHRP
jgi:hypothetical protein